MTFSDQEVAFGVAFSVALGETPKVTFLSLFSYFEFFGVSGLGGQQLGDRSGFSRERGSQQGSLKGVFKRCLERPFWRVRPP